MFGIFKEIRELRHRVANLEDKYLDHDSKLVEFDKKLDSRAYYDMVGSYEAKEKHLCKKAVKIITSGEKPKVTENVFRVLSTRLIKYKNLTIHLNPKGNTVWYKDFTFNEENSKMLSNLYESLKKGVF